MPIVTLTLQTDGFGIDIYNYSRPLKTLMLAQSLTDTTGEAISFAESIEIYGDVVCFIICRRFLSCLTECFFFGQFGGKLVSFENVKLLSNQQHARNERPVFISQVVTETELVARSMHLEKTLADGHFTKFCDEKIASSKDLNESTVWSFLKVPFTY
jgi:hypothetical protein